MLSYTPTVSPHVTLAMIADQYRGFWDRKRLRFTTYVPHEGNVLWVRR